MTTPSKPEASLRDAPTCRDALREVVTSARMGLSQLSPNVLAYAEALAARQEAGAVDEHEIRRLQDCEKAWLAVCKTLHEVFAGWIHGEGTGIERAVLAIRALATPPASGEAGADDDLAARVEELENELQEARETVAEEYERDAGAALRGLMKLIGHEWDEPLTAFQQADAIAECIHDHRRRLAAVAPAGMDGWVPVSERLPEEYGWYHCAVEGVGDLGMARWQEIVSLGHYADYGKRFSTASGVRVTHWRPLGPLPTPPATAGQE